MKELSCLDILCLFSISLVFYKICIKTLRGFSLILDSNKGGTSMFKDIVKKVKRYILIKRINKALDIQLTEVQKKYIFDGYDGFITGERKQGITTAHCIRLSLSQQPIYLDYLKHGRYSDLRISKDYDRWFAREFMFIRNELSRKGIKVCELIKYSGL